MTGLTFTLTFAPQVIYEESRTETKSKLIDFNVFPCSFEVWVFVFFFSKIRIVSL